MRRFLPFLLVLVLACNFLTPGRGPTPGPGAASSATPVRAVTQTAQPATATVAPTTVGPTTLAATPLATSTSAALPATPVVGRLTAKDVHFEPDPQLYSGDRASIIVTSPGGQAGWQGVQARVFIDSVDTPPLAQATFGPYGLGNQMQATFTWVWDTSGLVGPQTIYVETAAPAGQSSEAYSQTVAVPVTILPADARPAPEAGAQWATSQSECCIFNYLTDTAAARDIDLLRSTADAALAHDEAVLGVTLQGKITFTMLSRLLGNGGFTTDEVSITYIDRNAAASDLYTIFAHEGTHVLDRQIARTRPIVMTEGLAVYVAGGHFQKEPLETRAAGLLTLDRYIPLAQLANNFYLSQHEIGYLEGGGFIQYLVDQYGWDSFKNFYGSFNSAPSDAQMLDAGLQAHYGQSLSQMEAAWLAYLKALPPDPAQVDNLRLTIALHDAMRRYQQLDDPSAYFLAAWLPNGAEARKQGVTADFIRHPDGPDNMALEAMLVAGWQALVAGDDTGAQALVDGVNAALDAGSPAANPLAAEELAVVQQVLAAGYEPQTIHLDQDVAMVQAVRTWPQLEPLTLRRGAGGWQVLASGWLNALVHFGE